MLSLTLTFETCDENLILHLRDLAIHELSLNLSDLLVDHLSLQIFIHVAKTPDLEGSNVSAL